MVSSHQFCPPGKQIFQGRADLLQWSLLVVLVPTFWIVSASAARSDLIRGVSYGPVPLKSQTGASQLPQDDFFCDEAVPMWGRGGRGDLRVMKQLGANMVRLYGNNPMNDHANFLDEALAEGLSVAPGMSDWPFYQQVPGSCMDTEFNCFSQVKPLYKQNLLNGFLRPDNTYHPALKFMNILNEPDLKMPPDTDIGDSQGPMKMARALISAFDAMLDAEKEVGVTGPLVNYTVTFSYAICAACAKFARTPALAQMATLDDAMKNPRSYGYTPKNNITEAYIARFTSSFNTQNPATDLKIQFLDDYLAYFPSTPVYIGEYHRVRANQTDDLETILELAEEYPLFLGISFFEYQVAYWKTGSEMDFGMFGLGDYVAAQMPYFSKEYTVYCLTPQPNNESGLTIPEAVAKVYGGRGFNASTACVANPDGVALNGTGFSQILQQANPNQMARFIERMINHMGGTVKPNHQSDLLSFARYYDKAGFKFPALASALGSRPSWVDFSDKARCVANRQVAPSVIGEAIGWACNKATTFSCADIPAYCNSTYRIGDFVFSRYYEELGKNNPLVDCSFGGAALFASPELYKNWTATSNCVEGGLAPSTHSGDTTTTSPVPPSTNQPGMSTPESTSRHQPDVSTTNRHHDITNPAEASVSHRLQTLARVTVLGLLILVVNAEYWQ